MFRKIRTERRFARILAAELENRRRARVLKLVPIIRRAIPRAV